MSSELKISNINIEEITKYVYIMYTKDELRKYGVISCVPERQTVIDGTDKGKPTLAVIYMYVLSMELRQK